MTTRPGFPVEKTMSATVADFHAVQADCLFGVHVYAIDTGGGVEAHVMGWSGGASDKALVRALVRGSLARRGFDVKKVYVGHYHDDGPYPADPRKWPHV
jgi:hypothetical protein